MLNSDLAALYRGARVGGDFFEFVQVDDRLIFALLDIAGRREQALDIATAVQEALRQLVPKMFRHSDLNEADAVTELVLQLNKLILQAANGVRCSPGFVGCYNEPLGIISYVNAGHLPALVRDGSGVATLEASGLPLGLFSHATHDSQVCALPERGTLLLVSKGLLEFHSGSEEYGVDRLKEILRRTETTSAHEMCSAVLRNVSEFAEKKRRRRFLGLINRYAAAEGDSLGENDITAVALIRAAARARASAR